jgi:hypothetical protein
MVVNLSFHGATGGSGYDRRRTPVVLQRGAPARLPPDDRIRASTDAAATPVRQGAPL